MKYFLLILSLLALTSCTGVHVTKGLRLDLGEPVHFDNQVSLALSAFELTKHNIVFEFEMNVYESVKFKECFPRVAIALDQDGSTLFFLDYNIYDTIYDNIYDNSYFFPPTPFKFFIYINHLMYSNRELDLLVFDIETYYVKIVIEVENTNYNKIYLEIYRIPRKDFDFIYFNVTK